MQEKETMELEAAGCALVVLDLQKGLSGNPFEPHSEDQVVSLAGDLAKAVRTAGGPVVMVNVGWHSDFGDALQQPVDLPMSGEPPGPDWLDFLGDIHDPARDIVITKRQWGAFYGTELDLQMRRRGVDTLILAGYATNLAVESTARAGWELGYHIVFAEDAMASFMENMHQFAVSALFPMIGRVRSVDEIVAALG